MTEYPDAGIAVSMSDRRGDGIATMPALDVMPMMRRGRDRAGP